MKPGRRVLGAILWAALTLTAAAPGCGRSSPPPAPPPAPPPPDETGVPRSGQEPGQAPQAEPAPPVPAAAAPAIPATPAAGTIDAAPFVLAGAWIDESVLTLTDIGGRSVVIAIFRPGSGDAPSSDGAGGVIDLTAGPIPFGSPHIIVRPGPGGRAETYTDGYRLRLELPDPTGGDGGLWLELPGGRGTIAGRFEPG